ncbi:unnamed protein product [Periconia digitata]|uniref:Uncharacterized protein n=1 Tax=Periconia digitata TaxID=1303443 RepID=A0A9W4U7Y7_9PLEO|nr:unnamed protein product [Periconia digitata]
MASPVLTPDSREVAVTETSATVRSPMVIRNDLDPTEGRVRTRSTASCNRFSFGVSGRYIDRLLSNTGSRSFRESTIRDIFGGFPKRIGIGRSMGVEVPLASLSLRMRRCSCVAVPTTE